ncbi:MAG: hypothetical protein KAW87_07660, partial [Candidatus Cloacimonetes bacterium]|nr:hypothetical protein [Candidatus Cloacimonadota bacterium]
MKKVLYIGASICIIFILSCGNTNQEEQNIYAQSNFWKDGYFHQTNVITPEPDENTIRAKVDGKWQEYTLQ